MTYASSYGIPKEEVRKVIEARARECGISPGVMTWGTRSLCILKPDGSVAKIAIERMSTRELKENLAIIDHVGELRKQKAQESVR